MFGASYWSKWKFSFGNKWQKTKAISLLFHSSEELLIYVSFSEFLSIFDQNCTAQGFRIESIVYKKCKKNDHLIYIARANWKLSKKLSKRWIVIKATALEKICHIKKQKKIMTFFITLALQKKLSWVLKLWWNIELVYLGHKHTVVYHSDNYWNLNKTLVLLSSYCYCCIHTI